jgi:hypothetical protein
MAPEALSEAALCATINSGKLRLLPFAAPPRRKSAGTNLRAERLFRRRRFGGP